MRFSGISDAHGQLQPNAPCLPQVSTPVKLREKAHIEDFMTSCQKRQEATSWYDLMVILEQLVASLSILGLVQFNSIHYGIRPNAPDSSQVTAPAKLSETAHKEESVALCQKIQEAVGLRGLMVSYLSSLLHRCLFLVLCNSL